MPATRALILIRLSRVTDATTSPERQLADCRRFCDSQGYDVVDVAEDLDVSGSTDPLTRSGSGPWLRDRLSEFDVIVAQKLDRVGRSARHISALMAYLNDAGKNLRCALDSTNITDAIGRMIVYVMATVAEMELANISQRNESAAQHNIAKGKYRGGLTPAGYRAVKDDAGDWRLIVDEEGLAPVLRDVVARIIGGDTVSSVVRDLNTRKVQTHKDRQAELNGKTVEESREWSYGSLRRVLTSPSLIGQATTREPLKGENGKSLKRNDKGELSETGNGDKAYGEERLIFGKDGLPLQRAEPIVTPADFAKLQKVLIETTAKYAPKTRQHATSAMLTHVLYCRCERAMYRVKGHKGRAMRYRCDSATRATKCGAGSVLLTEAETFVGETLLSEVGNLDSPRREYRVGTDHSATIADIDAQLESLAAAIGRFKGAALDNVLAQVDTLTAKRDELAAETDTESGWHYVPSGETFAEQWEKLDDTGRNNFLRERSIRVIADKDTGKDATYSIDRGDLLEIVKAVNPEVWADIMTDVNREVDLSLILNP